MNLQLKTFWRLYVILFSLTVVLGLVFVRILYLQIWQKDFLQNQGKLRMQRAVSHQSIRSNIYDRHGEPLAISTPVSTLWADPRILAYSALPIISKELKLNLAKLQASYKKHKAFIYIQRHMDPGNAKRIVALKIPGVFVRYEQKRFYPAGEITSQVVGITDIDGNGQEGLELAYNAVLTGTPGYKRVIKDRLGRVIRHVESISEATTGEDIQLTLDLKIQYRGIL